MDRLDASGKFWIPPGSISRIDGTIEWEPGKKTRLVTASRLIDELSRPVSYTDDGGMTISYSGEPASIVADYVPQLILGDTDQGALTGIDSYLQSAPISLFDFDTPPLQQTRDSSLLVVGAHLSDGWGTEVEGVRFILDQGRWWSHIPEGDSSAGVAGKISVSDVGDRNFGVEFTPSSPMSLRRATMTVTSVSTLIKMVLDVKPQLNRLQVRVAGSPAWLDVLSGQLERTASVPPYHNTLLPINSLTLNRFARWMGIEQTMDGLAAGVAQPVKGSAIQVQAIIACSLIEGVHKRIRAGSHHYIKRAQELVDIARTVDPDIVDPVTDWAALVKGARNDLAHHNAVRSIDLQVYDWIIVEESAIWVLRLCLLLEAGFSVSELRNAVANFQRYQFYRENLKQHWKERQQLNISGNSP